MARPIVVTVDARAVLGALDALPAALRAAVMRANKTTADAIATEARRRIRRRTGRTAQAITVTLAYRGDGYVIYVGDPRTHIGRFLEYGTKFMTPKPFLFASARIEEGAHQRRIQDAVQAALVQTGLGD